MQKHHLVFVLFYAFIFCSYFCVEIVGFLLGNITICICTLHCHIYLSLLLVALLILSFFNKTLKDLLIISFTTCYGIVIYLYVDDFASNITNVYFLLTLRANLIDNIIIILKKLADL